MAVQFLNSSYEVNENNETVTVCVSRNIETAIAFNVTVTSRQADTIEGMEMHTSVTCYMYHTLVHLAMAHNTATIVTTNIPW